MFNQTKDTKGCGNWEARLEDYLEGSSNFEVQQHLNQCAACRTALEDSRLAGELLREAMEPASEPSAAFLTGVMMKIRAEQVRVESPAAFWRPLELLASRLALTAALVLFALSAYLVELAPGRNVDVAQVPSKTEISASELPQPPQEPVSNEEVLQSLAERSNGR